MGLPALTRSQESATLWKRSHRRAPMRGRNARATHHSSTPRRARHGPRRSGPARARPGRDRPGAGRRRRCRPAPDQPVHLRHELRRRGPRARPAAAGAPLGRQRHHPLQLPRRHHQPRATGSSRTSRTTTPIRRTSPNGSETDRFVEQNRRTGTADGPDRAAASAGSPKDRAAVVRLQRRQVRPAAVDRPVATRLRQRHQAGRHDCHRQRSAGHQHRRRSGSTSPTGSTTSTGSSAPPPTAASHSTTSTTSRTSGTPPTATSTRPGSATTSYATATYAYAAAIKAADPGAKTLGPVGWGWNSITLSGLDQDTCGRTGCWWNPPDRPRTAARTSSRGTCSRCARTSSSTARASSTTSTSTSTRRQSGVRSARGRRRRHPGAAAALDPLAVGPDLRRRELDQRRRCVSRGCGAGSTPTTRARRSPSPSTTGARSSTSTARSPRPTSSASSAAKGSTWPPSGPPPTAEPAGRVRLPRCTATTTARAARSATPASRRPAPTRTSWRSTPPSGAPTAR